MTPRPMWIRTLVGLGLCASACSEYAPSGDPCRPYDIIPTLQTPMVYIGSNGMVLPACEVDETGTVTLQYTPLSCTASAGWWAGCTFAANQDLRAFDARQGLGEGVIAVELCVKDFVPSSLNLRYGSPPFSANGRTKFLPVIRAEEQFAGSGCRLVYLSASDACYSIDRCGGDAGCVTDRDTGAGAQCDSFARSQLTIVNEFCLANRPAATKPTVVTIRKVTYFPASCTCEGTGSCTAPRVCRRDGWPAAARCDSDTEQCPGVCAP